MVAPIKDKCLNPLRCSYNRDVTLPPGRWVHLWTGVTYGEEGAVSEITISSPLGEPAVFYPLGSEVGSTFVSNLRAADFEIPSPTE